MPVDECISAEELAQLFHRYHGVLTGCFDGRTATAPWDQVDSHQRRLLIATARLVLSDLAAKQQAGESHESDPTSEESADLRGVVSSKIASPGVGNNGGNTDPASRDDASTRRYYAKPGQAEWGC